MAGYEDIAGLEDVYLEDSWVLGVYELDDSLSFDLEAVLIERHPQWKPPKAGEMYCYRRMALTFLNVRRIEWLERGTRPATDATGEEDWGHIDTFVADDGHYELTGDWGWVRFSSDTPQLFDR
jgi:hypothetical protein